MKVLYLDLLSPPGHKNLNKILVRLLKDLALVDVSWEEGYIEDRSLLSTAGSFYPIPKIYYNFNSKIDYRIKNYNKIKWVLKNISIASYDVVFISSYETISFALAWPKNLSNINTRVFILNHNNPDELGSSLKRKFFKRIPKYVEHIVFEEYMKDYLLNDIKISNRVWVIHHPIDLSKVHDSTYLHKNDDLESKGGKLIFAPSGSNDEDFIARLVDLQRNEKFLDDTQFVLLIKSKQTNYKDSHLIVTKKYFSYQEYISYLDKAYLILLPYPQSFRYRISGVLFDAFAFKKKIIATSIPLFRYFVEKYPFTGKVFNDVQEFKEIVYFYDKQVENGTFENNVSFEEVWNTYSVDSVREEVRRMLEGER